MTQAGVPIGFTSQFATVDRLRLHYVRGGSGPVVVFLHGYGADYTAYELRAHAGAGVGDLVEVVLEAPGERVAEGRVL